MRETTEYAPRVATARDSATQGLAFEQTVPRAWVHKTSVADVLLTDSRQVDESHYAAAAQWPRRHHFSETHEHSGASGVSPDIRLVTETVLQTARLIAHAYYAVPLGHHIQVTDLRIEPRATTTHGDSDRNLVLDSAVEILLGGGTHPLELRVDVTLNHEDAPIAHGQVQLRVIPARTYNRMRGTRFQAVRTEIGDYDGDNGSVIVDISQPPRSGSFENTITPRREWLIVPPRSHPMFFDGPTDQVPVTLLIEAARQAAGAVCGRPARIQSCSLSGDDWVELDQQTRLQLRGQTTDRAGLTTLMCVITQGANRPNVTIQMTVLTNNGELHRQSKPTDVTSRGDQRTSQNAPGGRGDEEDGSTSSRDAQTGPCGYSTTAT